MTRRFSNSFCHFFVNLVLCSLICGAGWSPVFAQVADDEAAAVEDSQTSEESAAEESTEEVAEQKDADADADAAEDSEAESAPPKMSESEVKAKVAELLKLLESRDEAERDKAEAELVEIGSAALGQLPTVTVDTAEEMRARLNRVRKKLEKAAAESILVGSRVTISGEMKLSEALAELEKQTENKLLDFRDQFSQPQLDPALKLELDDVPYWNALNTVLEQAGLQLYAYTNEPNTLGYVARSGELTEAGQAAATELFRMEVIRLQAIRDLRDEQNQGLVMTVEVTWEPRLTPISISQSLAGLSVKDEKGNELKPLANRGITNLSVQAGIQSVELELPFELPKREIQKVSLAGELNAVVPAGNMTLEFDDLDNARETTKGGGALSVILLRARKSQGLYDLRLLLRFGEASEEMRMQRGWVYSNEAYLLDPDGEQVEYAGLENFRENQNEIGLSYKYDIPGDLKGYKFVYKSPSSVLNVPVKYEIKDIVLP